jgi:hypothetical protein
MRAHEARQVWCEIRALLKEMYTSGEHHQIMASTLGLTRVQLQSQLRHLFREGMPKR